jgi:hypothetical protein
MTTLDHLRTRNLQLERELTQDLSEEKREQIDGELTKIEIALRFLEDSVKAPAREAVQKAAAENGPPA